MSKMSSRIGSDKFFQKDIDRIIKKYDNKNKIKWIKRNH